MTFATKCWNCQSKNFRETVDKEYCPDCGIECDYWGKGANEKYDQASARMHEKRDAAHEAEMKRLFGED